MGRLVKEKKGFRNVVVAATPPVAVRATVPGAAQLVASPGRIGVQWNPADVPWQPGGAHELGAALLFAPEVDTLRRSLTLEANPLAPAAFAMTMGRCLGYNPARGLYEVIAQTSPTDRPPRGLHAGARFTVKNDDRRRTILVDQRDPWGGISGGLLRDERDEPLPVVIQFGLNFPELHREAKEPGWATLTYPLELAPNEKRTIYAEHLYHGLTDREVMYLTSLENIGNPLLLQTTVGRNESHTLTTGPYPGPRKPGNELRINDFRRIYSQIRVRSISAILPTFFGYWDASETYHGLLPGPVTFRETGPFLIDYTVAAATAEGGVSGRVRIWQAAHADMTRVFTDVSLNVNRALTLSTRKPAPVFFLRHHAFNPMAFSRFAYTAVDGRPKEDKLTFTPTVAANGVPFGRFPFACLYRADNRLDRGFPCSDLTGNSWFVLLDWQVTFGQREVRPGCYAFCTGAGDTEHGAYARDVAVVPTERIAVIPAGSKIRYRAVQMVWGDNAADFSTMEQERQRWALHPLTVRVTAGQLVSADPPEVKAEGGRCTFSLTGGADWVPVRVVGCLPGVPLHVRQTDSTGTRLLGPANPEEPWYNAWPDPQDPGKCGFTFLVKKPAGGEPVKLSVSQFRENRISR